MSSKRSGLRKCLVVVGVLALVVPLLLAWAAPVSAATITVCGSGCDYTTIQAAVNDANDDDVIHVYPGTYVEQVDLSGMAPDGDITLVTVNSSGVATPGTATVDGGGGKGLYMSSYFDGDVTIDGFVVTASGNGVDLDVYASYDVVVRNVDSETDDDGIHIKMHGSGSGSVVVENCVTNGNGDDGIDVRWPPSEDSPSGNLHITNCSANDNGDHGMEIDDVPGDVTVRNCTAERNVNVGFRYDTLDGDLSMLSCVARNNLTGIYLETIDWTRAFEVRGSIICGNGEYGLELNAPNTTLDGRANWWGCAAGPWNPGCDKTASGIGSTLLVDPVIDYISGSATVPAVVGHPTLVTFQFSGGPPAVYLGEGPGDLHGDPRFIVGTDNGTVASSGFIGASDGKLEVTLTPAHTGTATVYVDGPCDLDESIVLGVVAAQEFVPEPGSVLLLGSGLVGLAGYASLRLRKR